MSDIVLLETRGPAFWITINRPDKRNALNPEVIAGIAAGFRAAESDPSVRVIVLTAAGDKAFCAGGDLAPGAAFAFDVSEPSTGYANLFRQVRASPLPSIARVNGACLAGGMGLLCMADLAVAVESAPFGLPEAKIGLFPFQVMALLKELIGPRALRELALVGKPFTAAQAQAIGLLNRVAANAEQLDAAVAELVDGLAANSPMALRRGKYALRSIESMTFEQALAFTEGQLVLMAQSADAKEGLASFNEKRKPRWSGSERT